MSKKNSYHELAKNDPNFHDIRAKILLDAAQAINHFSDSTQANAEFKLGIKEASAELRRMASNARRAHKKLQDERQKQARASEAKAEAFGFGG